MYAIIDTPFIFEITLSASPDMPMRFSLRRHFAAHIEVS